LKERDNHSSGDNVMDQPTQEQTQEQKTTLTFHGLSLSDEAIHGLDTNEVGALQRKSGGKKLLYAFGGVVTGIFGPTTTADYMHQHPHNFLTAAVAIGASLLPAMFLLTKFSVYEKESKELYELQMKKILMDHSDNVDNIIAENRKNIEQSRQSNDEKPQLA
jgi:hypothetical protein